MAGSAVVVYLRECMNHAISIRVFRMAFKAAAAPGGRVEQRDWQGIEVAEGGTEGCG